MLAYKLHAIYTRIHTTRRELSVVPTARVITRQLWLIYVILVSFLSAKEPASKAIFKLVALQNITA